MTILRRSESSDLPFSKKLKFTEVPSRCTWNQTPAMPFCWTEPCPSSCEQILVSPGKTFHNILLISSTSNATCIALAFCLWCCTRMCDGNNPGEICIMVGSVFDLQIKSLDLHLYTKCLPTYAGFKSKFWLHRHFLSPISGL